jgi:hypothetical protein
VRGFVCFRSHALPSAFLIFLISYYIAFQCSPLHPRLCSLFLPCSLPSPEAGTIFFYPAPPLCLGAVSLPSLATSCPCLFAWAQLLCHHWPPPAPASSPGRSFSAITGLLLPLPLRLGAAPLPSLAWAASRPSSVTFIFLGAWVVIELASPALLGPHSLLSFQL